MLELDFDVFNHICVQRACISSLREYFQGASLSLPLVSGFRFRLYPVFCMLSLVCWLVQSILERGEAWVIIIATDRGTLPSRNC